jgi:hypothetical protein
MAFLTRESAIFASVFYAPLFLMAYRMRRIDYLWIVAGFAGVWACELLYLRVMTGDPLYRFSISLSHDATIDRTIDLAGNVIVHPFVDPLLVLLLNQEFMALFWFAIPAGAWLCLSPAVDHRTQRYARLVAWLGVNWFLCTAAVQTLLPLNPRYFLIPCLAACILLGIALAALRRPVALALITVVVAANVLGIAVENKASLFGERTVARIVAAAPGQVFVTDPMTRYRADLLLRWDGTQARLVGRAPRPGDRYLANPARTSAPDVRMPASMMGEYQRKREWRALRRVTLRPTLLARAIDRTGLSAVMPPAIVRKLVVQHPPVVEYDVR